MKVRPIGGHSALQALGLSAKQLLILEARHTVEDWQYEVANGDTRLGYEEWLLHRFESNQRRMDI